MGIIIIHSRAHLCGGLHEFAEYGEHNLAQAWTGRATQPQDLESILAVAKDIGTFTPEEIICLEEDIHNGLSEVSAGDQPDLLSSIFLNNHLVGFIQFGPLFMTDQTWMLHWIILSPSVHGQGIGQQLLQSVENEARKHGARMMLIETSDQPFFTAARKLYEKCGFELTATIADFYERDHGKCIYRKLF